MAILKALPCLILAISSLFCGTVCLASPVQKLPELVDRAPIRVSGVIRMERRGNRSFLMVWTKDAYTVVFDHGTDERRVHEIGLSLEGQNGVLEKHAGQFVRVDGVLQLEGVSPYYWNGTLILAKSVRLPEGSLLLPKKLESRRPPSRDVSKYVVQMTFAPGLSRFSYKEQGHNGDLITAPEGYLSCGLNGPGDVVNCYCADGFEPTGIGQLRQGTFVPEEKPDGQFGFAQFGIPEELHRPIQKSIECVRKSGK